MTDEERNQEGAEQHIEDLEAPADAQSDVAGGLGCLPTNACNPVKTVVHCQSPTQFCQTPTCKVTKVQIAEGPPQ
jgi:hypothetical protein